MSDVIQWAFDAHSARYYPINLGLGRCPTIRLIAGVGLTGWCIEIPGVRLCKDLKSHETLEAAKVAAVRIIVELQEERIQSEASRLAEVKAWLESVAP